MKRRYTNSAALLAALLSILLLAGCGGTPAPENTAPAAESLSAEEEKTAEDGSIVVSTVDELLSALAPGASILIKEGFYELTDASDYGRADSGEYYSWVETFDGCELVISGLEGLSIRGEGEVTLSVVPRYANVLSFVNCSGLSLGNMTLGHTEEPGACRGGVLYLDGCSDVYIEGCALYGCGIIGIYTENCKGVHAHACEIYDCSQNAVFSVSGHDIRVTDSDIYACGGPLSQSIFHADSCMGFAVVNSRIHDNFANDFISARYSQQLSILGCELRDNVFNQALFACEGYPARVEDCAFTDNSYTYFVSAYEWMEALAPTDGAGETLTEEALLTMERAEAVYEGPILADEVALEETVNSVGLREVSVSTVDEFLAAIASDTVIKLEGEFFDLSRAADYGAWGSDSYYWVNNYDGPGLVISGVKNLSIVGEGAVISAIPRYANVLGFVNCDNITLRGFTAGHTEEPGSCVGGVLDFQNCRDINVEACALYGCGILGIRADNCSGLTVRSTEIYECSQGAVALYTVEGAVFEACDIHDCALPELVLTDSSMSYNGEKLGSGAYSLEKGAATEYIFG